MTETIQSLIQVAAQFTANPFRAGQSIAALFPGQISGPEAARAIIALKASQR